MSDEVNGSFLSLFGIDREFELVILSGALIATIIYACSRKKNQKLKKQSYVEVKEEPKNDIKESTVPVNRDSTPRRLRNAVLPVATNSEVRNS